MTFTDVEAKAALESIETLLRDMVAGRMDYTELSKVADFINVQQKAGAYPCTGVWLLMHSLRYPEATSFFALLLYAVIRARADATKGSLQ